MLYVILYYYIAIYVILSLSVHKWKQNFTLKKHYVHTKALDPEPELGAVYF